MKNFIIGFFKDEDGLETIEMVIILVVLVSIAFMFRKTLIKWFNDLIGEASRPSGIQKPKEGPSLN